MQRDTDILDMVVSELGKDLGNAADFVSSEFEEGRARAQRYYNGDSDLEVDGNRSKYVSTKVRDIVRSVKPSLMRTMLACDNPVEYAPQNAAQGMIAEMQTNYVSQLFYDLGGYKTIYEAFHSAMLFKLGVVKYWYEDTPEQIYRQYTGLTEQQVQMLTAHPLVEVLTGEEKQSVGPQGMISTFDIEVVGTKPAGSIRMEYVGLSEFVVDRNATSKDDARVMAHRRDVTKSDAVQMGFTMEQLEGLNSDNSEANAFGDESRARRGYTIYPTNDDTQDESMKNVLLTEAYYRADLDDTGIAQLYRFWLGGTSYELLDYERVDSIPFALFQIDPEPQTLWGKSLYDLVNKDADAITSLKRATIDNFHMTNNPRLAIHEHLVNTADVLSNDMGAPIRVRASGQIQVINTPFTGGQALPLLQMLEKDTENKTGVTAAASGLDPDALQSTDKEAVQNTIQLAQGQVELMARNLAETGLVDLFAGLLNLAMTHLDASQILRTPDGAQPVQINAFQPTMASRVKVGTGTGNMDQRMGMLDQILGQQKEIYAQYGPANPVVSMQQIQNTVADKMKLVGMTNPRRYFGMVTPEMEQQMQQQQAQQAQAKEQAQMQIAQQQAGALQQAEQIKAQAALQIAGGRQQLDMAKAVQGGQIEGAQLKQKEDASFRELLARDQMMQTLFLEVSKMREDFAAAQRTTQRAMN